MIKIVFRIKSNVVKTRLKKMVSNRGEFIKIQIPDDAFNFDDIEQVFKRDPPKF